MTPGAFGLLIGLSALFAAPVLAERMRRPLDKRLRGMAPGRFADLAAGFTHFAWHGPEEGPPMVLVHGLTTPSYVWDGLLPHLIGLGFRCLTYDLHGRGFSARPPGAQTRAFFLRQLDGLLAHERITGPVVLVGYSMGACIVTAFAAAHPGRVARLVLLAPAGLGHDLGRAAAFTTRVPVLGDWLMLGPGGWLMRRSLARQVGLPTSVPGIAARQMAETRRRGFLPAVLSSQRGMLAEDMGPDHRRVAAAGVPVLAVWGRDDTVIPLSAMERLAAANPAARQVVVDGAGHGLPHTHPGEVAAALRVALEG